MNRYDKYVAFSIDEQRFALSISAVERIERVVEISPLPRAPEIVHGVVNVEGRIIPVINIRKLFGFPEREIELSDKLIIADISDRTAALLVDSVSDVIESSDGKMTMTEDVMQGIKYAESIFKDEDGIIINIDSGKSSIVSEAINDQQNLRYTSLSVE